jgi:hypothetical protein
MDTFARPLAVRRWILLTALVALGLTATPAGSYSEHSVGTPEQIAWVRRAAGNFVSAELADSGAGACAILAAPLRASSHGRTCDQRWDAKLAAMLREHGARRRLRKLLGATASARVVVHVNSANIDLPAPLIDSANRFLWTENCWMLTH